MSEGPRLSALEKLRRETGAPALELVTNETEPGELIEERRAYSVIRGRRGQILTLDIRFANGNRMGLGYPYLSATDFDASGVLTLHFAGRRVIVEGIHLEPVYEALLNHAVGFLREQDAERDAMIEGEPFIQCITVTSKMSEQE